MGNKLIKVTQSATLTNVHVKLIARRRSQRLDPQTSQLWAGFGRTGDGVVVLTFLWRNWRGRATPEPKLPVQSSVFERKPENNMVRCRKGWAGGGRGRKKIEKLFSGRVSL